MIAGAAVCMLVVLLTAVYAMLAEFFTHAEYIAPCDIEAADAAAVREVMEKDLMTAEEKSGVLYFYPEEAVTRAELAKTLCLLLELPTDLYKTTVLGFADEMTITEAYLPYIRAVLSYGYMKLHYDETFRPSAEMTREETADIIGSLLVGAVSSGKSETYTDFETVEPHFAQNAKKAVEHGVMSGYPDGTFRPKHTLTREELANILYRLLQNEHL